MAEPRSFEELRVGECFRMPSRTVTDAEFAAFRTVSGDNHPIHYDREYCREHGHEGLLAHGLLVLAFTAAGAGSFPHLIGEALIGFIEQSARFLKPVYAGDTLYPALAITALLPQRTTGVVVMAASVHNQHGELVLAGEHKYLLRKRGDGRAAGERAPTRAKPGRP
ncbi:MAG: MaoC family dehydratase [Alphaproteobacteria bacterium]